MIGIGGERLLVPDLRLIVIAKLAVGVADVVCDVRMLVLAERMHRGDAAFVIAGEDCLARGAIAAQELLVNELLLLLLDRLVVFLFLFAVIGRRRRFGAHGVNRDRLDADGGDEQGGSGEHGGAANRFVQGHGVQGPLLGGVGQGYVEFRS